MIKGHKINSIIKKSDIIIKKEYYQKLKGRKIYKKIKNIDVTNSKKNDFLVTQAGDFHKKEVGGSSFKAMIPSTIFAVFILISCIYVIKDQFYTDKNDYNFISDYNSVNQIEKIDSTKKYVYLENEEQILYDKQKDFSYKESELVININKDTIKEIEEKLNNNKRLYHDSYIYSNDIKYALNYSKYNTENNYLKSFIYDEYEIYETNNYVSIVVVTHNIDYDINNISNITTYNIDINTGKIYKDEEILKVFNKTSSDIVKEFVIAYKSDNSDIYFDEIIKKEYNFFMSNDCVGLILESDSNYNGYDVYLSEVCQK